jgi:hypothetical protein
MKSGRPSGKCRGASIRVNNEVKRDAYFNGPGTIRAGRRKRDGGESARVEGIAESGRTLTRGKPGMADGKRQRGSAALRGRPLHLSKRRPGESPALVYIYIHGAQDRRTHSSARERALFLARAGTLRTTRVTESPSAP